VAIFRRRMTSVERQAQEEFRALRESRRNRFRILVCIDGSEESYEGLRFAAEIGRGDECDIILLFVRPFDQGLRTGGLQMNVARENMLEWGLELPSVQHLKKGLEVLIELGQMDEDWQFMASHSEVRGDPVGDHKVEYTRESGKTIILKLKTAPDAASGILDQYELGPYNLIILGAQHRWQGDFRSLWDAGVTQKVAMLAPCSTLVTRKSPDGEKCLICIDGSAHSLDVARRAAVLAKHLAAPISLLSVARNDEDRSVVERQVADAKAALEDIGIDVADALVRSGDPVEQIIKIGADYKLVVVSDSGKSRIKRFLIGSVAFGVMGHARTSVLNVR